MNRTLKRPMFRIGGSAGTGITSGLDQPQKMANGGRTGYQQGSMPTFQAQGLPGFLTSFGLNLLATPPQGNIFQTAATAARDPFNQLQISQARAREQQGERDFLRGERIAGDESAMERLKTKIASDERIAGNKTNDALYNVMLEKFIEDDLPPQVAERAAKFSTQNADELRTAVTGTKYGGVLTFDIRDPNNQKTTKNCSKSQKTVHDISKDTNNGPRPPKVHSKTVPERHLRAQKAYEGHWPFSGFSNFWGPGAP